MLRPDSEHVIVVVPPLEDADPRDPAECAEQLARWGAAFEHVSVATRPDGFAVHLWKQLARYPPVLRGRIQGCRGCGKVVFHAVPIDFCSTVCVEEQH